MQVKSIAECSKRAFCAPKEHSAILLTFIKLPIVFTGFIQGSLTKKIQGLLKTILQFSRTKSLGKILIEVLKFFFKNHTGQCKRTGGCYNELVVAFFSTGGGVKKSIPIDYYYL